MEILALHGSRLPSRMRLVRSIRGLGLALLLLTPQAAAQQRPLEDEVKAAFLLNFTKFVEWPASAFLDNSTPISLCILGEGPVADTLAHLVQDERAHGRAIAVKTVKAPGPSDGCHVLFIARSEKDVRTLLAGVRPGVLTVGESDSFIAEGGMIKFVVENRRVRFDISQAKAARAMLAVNGRLLNVARVVEK